MGQAGKEWCEKNGRPASPDAVRGAGEERKRLQRFQGALGQQQLHGPALDLDLDIVGDFEIEVIVGQLLDLARDAAGNDDFVADLQRVNEILGARLNTIHNLYYYQALMRDLRAAIETGGLVQFVEQFQQDRSRMLE